MSEAASELHNKLNSIPVERLKQARASGYYQKGHMQSPLSVRAPSILRPSSERAAMSRPAHLPLACIAACGACSAAFWWGLVVRPGRYREAG